MKTLIVAMAIAALCAHSERALGADADAAVTLSEGPRDYTLANGIVTARIAKRLGDLESLKYRGLELLSAAHPPGYWSHTPARGSGMSIRDDRSGDKRRRTRRDFGERFLPGNAVGRRPGRERGLRH